MSKQGVSKFWSAAVLPPLSRTQHISSVSVSGKLSLWIVMAAVLAAPTLAPNAAAAIAAPPQRFLQFAVLRFFRATPIDVSYIVLAIV